MTIAPSRSPGRQRRPARAWLVPAAVVGCLCLLAGCRDKHEPIKPTVHAAVPAAGHAAVPVTVAHAAALPAR